MVMGRFVPISVPGLFRTCSLSVRLFQPNFRMGHFGPIFSLTAYAVKHIFFDTRLFVYVGSWAAIIIFDTEKRSQTQRGLVTLEGYE